MIGYLDITFCRADCASKYCPRHKQHLVDNPDFERWAKAVGGKYVSMADFSKDCTEYRPIEETDETS